MNTPEKCPCCGSGTHGGTSWYSRFECRTILWDDGTFRFESPQCKINQLTTALSDTSTKLHLTQDREHDLKRVLADMQMRRDQNAVDLATHREINAALAERIRHLESSLRECTEWIYWESTNDSRDAFDIECYRRAINLLKS